MSPEYLGDLADVKQTKYSLCMKTQSRYLQPGLSHMGRDHLGSSLPVCGTACSMSSEQQRVSESSKFWSAHG